MRVISLKRLRKFWQKFPDAELYLRAWYRASMKSSWPNIAAVRQAYPHADVVTLNCGVLVTIFNIRGNNYWLVTRIDYDHHHIDVKRVMAHREYNGNRWQEKICNG